MIKLSRNPLRWILALALMPVAPLLVLWVANFGRESAEKVWALGMPVFLENPWMLVPLAAMGPALILGTLLHLLMRPVKDSSIDILPHLDLLVAACWREGGGFQRGLPRLRLARLQLVPAESHQNQHSIQAIRLYPGL